MKRNCLTPALILLLAALLLAMILPGCQNTTPPDNTPTITEPLATESVLITTAAHESTETADAEPTTTGAESIPDTEPDTEAPTVSQTEPTTGVPEPQPTEPAPTEPKPTQPKPTEPKPTQPKPTEPKPTQPKPTEPKPTEPKPTQPKPTEPKPTEPKPTQPKPTEPKCSKWEDHTWSNWIQVKAPTSCKEEGAGEEQIVCTKCGYVVQTSYPTLPHHWSNWKQTKAPTCSANGAEARTCGNCGKTETRELEKLSHSYTSQTVAPTCTAGGYTVKTCSLCGAKETVDQTAALGHAWVHHSEDGWWQSVITCYCGEKFYSIRGVEGSAYSAWDAHSDSFYDTENEDDHAGYEIHEVWVIDTPAYDVCSRCGAK